MPTATWRGAKAPGGIAVYAWDVENRLRRVEDGTGGVVAEYYYDPFGRRLWKDVDGARTYYVYADEGLVAELDETGQVTRTYGWQPDGMWGTNPLWMEESGEYYFYHNDHLGTPQKMTDAVGNVVWAALYTSFGEATVLPYSTVENNLRFPGQHWDGETGLCYNWNRYYYRAIGQYVSKDPVYYGKDINTYLYVLNNPLKSKDIYGLFVNVVYNWFLAVSSGWRQRQR